MRRSVVSALALAASIGFVSSASAADLPAKAPMVKALVVAPYNWGGWYVGGNVGYGWGKGDFDNLGTGSSEMAVAYIEYCNFAKGTKWSVVEPSSRWVS